MKVDRKRSIGFVFLVLFIGIIISSILAQFIGNIIPGLIANWMDKQGVIRTISTVLITACVTHLFFRTLFVYQILLNFKN